jgi:ENTH domain
MNFFQPPTTRISQAERELQPLLVDEGIQVLSTFEMNKVASLTYSDIVCDDIFELFEKILSQPLDFSSLTIEKTLVVTRHVMIYGSEKCVNSAYGIGRFIENLTTFNSVLAAQQQQGVNAFFQRIQGGGVDRGGPIREAAQKVQELLRNINHLQRIRNECASKNSLVPIGDDKIAFITDEVRHIILKKKIEQQQRIEIKSNLAKSEGGWGAGYMAKDGKNVVGAAHGIEEMIKMAQREKSKFSDGGISFPSAEEKILQELAEEARRNKEAEKKERTAQIGDLLGFTEPSPAVDLLDFGVGSSVGTAPVASASGDLLGFFDAPANSTSIYTSSAGTDLLGLGAPTIGRSQLPQQSLLDLASDHHVDEGLLSLVVPTDGALDPFASVDASFQPSLNGSLLPDGEGKGLSGLMNTLNIGGLSKPAVPPLQEDRFAALDALASTTLTPNPSTSFDSKTVDNVLSMGVTASTGYSMGVGQSWSVPTSGNHAPLMASLVIAEPMLIAPGGGQVAAAYGDVGVDNDNPWVMGGTTGTGLQPLGEAPAAPPPPPPPQ